MKPSVAARLYAGATDATPITTLETSPRAPDLRPLGATSPEEYVAVASEVISGSRAADFVDAFIAARVRFRKGFRVRSLIQLWNSWHSLTYSAPHATPHPGRRRGWFRRR